MSDWECEDLRDVQVSTVNFGAALKMRRKALKISSQKHAKACGWSKTQVHRIERSTGLTEATVRRYAAGLGLTATLSFALELDETLP